MITVEDKEEIRRLFYVENKSIRWIARQLGHSRKTVRKALADSSPPVYQLKSPRPSPKMGSFIEQIDQWLAEDLNNPPKQHLTARRIYQLLREQPEFSAAESTVRRVVRLRRQLLQPPELFIPLAYEPGVDAQCDFGEAVVLLKGERVTAQLFCMRLCYSKRSFVMAFPTQKQEALFEGHQAAFAFYQGVPHCIWYDNLKPAVKRILEGRNREEQVAFISFRSHYLFESRFCTPRQAHEKGLAEGLVGYSRRNFLVPLPEVDSWEELNHLLWQRCQAEDGRRLRGEKQTIGELWAAEKPSLLPLPAHPYPCCTLHPVRANRFSLVTFETNRYSVPPEYAQCQLVLKAYVWRVEIVAGDKVIATHPRCYEREQDILDPFHYLPLLMTKPGAFDHAKALREWRASWPEVYARYRQGLEERHGQRRGTQEFIRILELHRTYPPEQVRQAVEWALSYHSYSFDVVQNLLHQLTTARPEPSPLDLSALPELAAIQVPRPDLDHFNRLLAGAPGG
jgi:transposase